MSLEGERGSCKVRNGCNFRRAQDAKPETRSAGCARKCYFAAWMAAGIPSSGERESIGKRRRRAQWVLTIVHLHITAERLPRGRDAGGRARSARTHQLALHSIDFFRFPTLPLQLRQEASLLCV